MTTQSINDLLQKIEKRVVAHRISAGNNRASRQTTHRLAELQAALPDGLPSAKPLRLVLDRRPFI